MGKKILPVALAMFVKDISDEGLFLWMQIRQEEGPLFGLWEFPGGKIEAGETPEEAMKREVQEEVNVSLEGCSRIRPFKLYPYDYKDRSICLYSFVVEYPELTEELGKWHFISTQEKSAPFKGLIPEVNHEIIDELVNYLHHLFTHNAYEALWKL